MTAIDTNVLIHFHREESPKHREALALVTALAEGDATWAVPVDAMPIRSYWLRRRTSTERQIESSDSSVDG